MPLLNALPPGTATKLVDERDIVDGFRRHNVDHKRWPEFGPYTLPKLRQTLDEEEVELEDTGDRIQIRVKVSVVLLSHLTGRSLFELHESARILLPSRTRETRDFRGIAETRKKAESAVAAAHRTIAEEPGYSAPLLKDRSMYYLNPMPSIEIRGPEPSEKWFGIWAIWERSIYSAMIVHAKAYKPHGYFEIEHGKKISIFRWKDRSNESTQIPAST